MECTPGNPYEQCPDPSEHITDLGGCRGDSHDTWEEGYHFRDGVFLALLGAAEDLIRELPEAVMEEMRDVWGNTNFQIIMGKRWLLTQAITRARGIEGTK